MPRAFIDVNASKYSGRFNDDFGNEVVGNVVCEDFGIEVVVDNVDCDDDDNDDVVDDK